MNVWALIAGWERHMRIGNAALMLAVLASMAALPVAAKLPYKFYREAQKRGIDQNMRSYIHGVGNGYVWANAQLHIQKRQPLFCPPTNLALSEDNFSQLLDDEIKKIEGTGTRLPDDTSVEAILLRALEETFPCK
jgi:hypothetical protein